MTLVYLGNVDDAARLAITQKASQIQATQFAFQLDEIAHWREPKTLCLTVSQQPQALHYLVDSLVAIVAQYPIHLHDRPYRAHATLMRKVKQVYPLQFEPIAWAAKDFVLVESISTADGIVYEVLARWPLTLS